MSFRTLAPCVNLNLVSFKLLFLFPTLNGPFWAVNSKYVKKMLKRNHNFMLVSFFNDELNCGTTQMESMNL